MVHPSRLAHFVVDDAMRLLHHAVALPAIAGVAKCFQVSQAIASALREGKSVMDFEANTDPTSTAPDAGKIDTLRNEESLPQGQRFSLAGGVSGADSSSLDTDSSVTDAAALTRALRQDPNRRFIVSFERGNPYSLRSSC